MAYTTHHYQCIPILVTVTVAVYQTYVLSCRMTEDLSGGAIRMYIFLLSGFSCDFCYSSAVKLEALLTAMNGLPRVVSQLNLEHPQQKDLDCRVVD